ncbi:NRAMP family divalent metal transporter [Flagellimonas sp.]|uniref:NRAMP family divalent metal transporter n=1 Tax=Flagellimonas sp. TaxID=2058762 RepID=UPI003F49BAAB
MINTKKLLKNLGPGLLFASMAIGTSHLVLSTKAGAQYGWIMIVPIVLANLFKYPFFEFGIRYTTVTQKSLIQGYLNMGKGYLWIYALVTLVSTFTILAALYIVTSGLFMNLFQLDSIDPGLVSLGLFAFISSILIIGRYQFLENSLKAVVTVLFVALLITTFLVVQKGPVTPIVDYQAPEIFNEVGILFLISLMGWMPTAVEASGWVSLWSIENQNTQKVKPSLKMALQEFNLGYILTAVLAIFFLIIGWLTLYGTGIELSGNAVIFADQVITLFTSHIGNWTYSLIAIAAFATMFSTCMTAHDAVTRVSIDVLKKLTPDSTFFHHKRTFAIGIILMALINWVVIVAFASNMGDLVALATFVSFVMAPLVGWMNLKAVMGKDMPTKHRPKKALQGLTYTGIVFLSLFALYYCWIVVS